MSGDAGLREAAARRGSFVGTVRAVAWSFLGIRRGSGHRDDMAKLNPVHVVLVGVAAAALFVVALLLLVQWVVSSGAAAR